MNPSIQELAQFVSGADDLESLSRPMLELLEAVTGLESTYLTMIDAQQGLQRIVYSRNSRQLNIPEGLSVPWEDTLCKRALEEGRPYTDNVSTCWGDSDAARDLGIQTYLSQPVHTVDGTLYGTLCAASGERAELDPGVLKIVALFARLIAQQVDRERLLAQLRQSNSELIQHAMTDPLTGIANRRALTAELGRLLARARRDGGTVAVAFIDLDRFKAINDHHGHDMGDRFLIEIATRLAACTRAGDLVARYGGDEFVVVAPDGDADELQARLQQATTGRFLQEQIALDYPGASVGVVTAGPGDGDADGLLTRADAAMYRVKQARR